MKATRKLIPALALLLVSAVLLSTASYAWFTTNTSVNATMNVQVTAPQNLQIREGSSGAWAYSVSLGDQGALKPASSVDGTTFYAVVGTGSSEAELDGIIDGTNYSIKADGSLVKGTAESGTPLTNTEIKKLSETDTGYVVTKTLQLRAVKNVAAGDLYVSVGINGTGGNVNNAIRVAITYVKGGDKVTEIFALGGATGETAIGAEGKAVSAPTNTVREAAAGAASEVESGATVLTDLALTAGTETTVTVTVWYEGNDKDCIATQVQEGSNANIDVRFSIF